MDTSRFTTAVVARNAPHLDESQAAALVEMSLATFDRWVNTLDDEGLADLVVQLQQWEFEAKNLLELRKMRCSPCLVEFAEDGLKIWARRTAFGELLALPTSGGRKASSPREAAMMIFSSGQPRS